MSDRNSWHIPPAVEVDGRPWHPAKSVLFLALFFGFCFGLAAWRRLG